MIMFPLTACKCRRRDFGGISAVVLSKASTYEAKADDRAQAALRALGEGDIAAIIARQISGDRQP